MLTIQKADEIDDFAGAAFLWPLMTMGARFG
jgi:hypothetical protein